MRTLRLALALLSATALTAPPLAHAVELLRASGTGTALGTLHRLAAPFKQANPGFELKTLTSIGSGGAFRAVAAGALDVGISARPLEQDEVGLGLVAFPYAQTPFLFAAGPRAGVKDLTHADAVRVYRGEVTSWPNGERLRLVLRPRHDADTRIVSSVSAELAAAVESAYAREGMLMALTNQECNEILVRTPGTLGASSLTQIMTEGLAITPLSWNGVAPTLDNLRKGAYPLRKTLYLVIKAPASAPVRRFVRFLASKEARRVLEESGNLPLALPPLE